MLTVGIDHYCRVSAALYRGCSVMANTLALGARVAVRVRHLLPEVKDYSLAFLYSSVVQLVERTTVNRDGTGSSPVRGAKNF